MAAPVGTAGQQRAPTAGVGKARPSSERRTMPAPRSQRFFGKKPPTTTWRQPRGRRRSSSTTPAASAWSPWRPTQRTAAAPPARTSGHVRAKLESGGGGGAVVRCPDASCAGTLDPELCRGVLPSDVFERWCAVLCEALFPAARRTYCPFPDCSEMMVADDGGGGSDCVTQSECQVCRRLFCARCRVAPWHAGVTGDEYHRLAKEDRGRREDMMLYEMAEEMRWKRCLKPPNASSSSTKLMAAHTFCRCGFEFCYRCGTTWGSTQSHYNCRG